jgi:GNAT superfamily N-acetyltransferase
MEKVTIRVATRKDLPEILQLYSQPYMDDGQVLSLSDAESIFERINEYPNYRIYVACRDGETLGTFSVLIMDNLAHMSAPSGIVENVVVAPEWQGKGIGRQMMQFAMQKCRETGCYKLVLSSHKSRGKAHRFYQSLGFEQHGYSFVVMM